jgi:hypothetical protein
MARVFAAFAERIGGLPHASGGGYIVNSNLAWIEGSARQAS